MSDMTDSEKANKVIEALKAAEREPPQAALPMLNELASLVQGEGEQPLEVEEARSSAFMAICEVGKALHRGQPTRCAVGAGDRGGGTVEVAGARALNRRSLAKQARSRIG